MQALVVAGRGYFLIISLAARVISGEIRPRRSEDVRVGLVRVSLRLTELIVPPIIGYCKTSVSVVDDSHDSSSSGLWSLDQG